MQEQATWREKRQTLRKMQRRHRIVSVITALLFDVWLFTVLATLVDMRVNAEWIQEVQRRYARQDYAIADVVKDADVNLYQAYRSDEHIAYRYTSTISVYEARMMQALMQGSEKTLVLAGYVEMPDGYHYPIWYTQAELQVALEDVEQSQYTWSGQLYFCSGLYVMDRGILGFFHRYALWWAQPWLSIPWASAYLVAIAIQSLLFVVASLILRCFTPKKLYRQMQRLERELALPQEMEVICHYHYLEAEVFQPRTSPEFDALTDIMKALD